jgi:hypothetical protein
MREAFDILKHFFIGAAYSVFAVGCVLAVVSEEVSYFSFFGAFVFAFFLLIFAWAIAIAGRGL